MVVKVGEMGLLEGSPVKKTLLIRYRLEGLRPHGYDDGVGDQGESVSSSKAIKAALPHWAGIEVELAGTIASPSISQLGLRQ
jgi:hypothetical protein